MWCIGACLLAFWICIYTSLVMRNPAFLHMRKQLRGNREADQRICFRYIDSSPLLPKSENINLWLSSVLLQPGLCQTWSETPKTGFLITRLICEYRAFVLLPILLKFYSLYKNQAYAKSIVFIRMRSLINAFITRRRESKKIYFFGPEFLRL